MEHTILASLLHQRNLRLSLNNDGTFLTESFFIEGRKIPLLDIRQRMLDTQENIGLLRAKDVDFDTLPMASINLQLQDFDEYDNSLNDSEKRQRLKEIRTTTHITCWADHSTIAGHSYVVYTISCLYDQSVFLTENELKERSVNIDVEEIVNKPQIHIIARCGSSDEDTVALQKIGGSAFKHYQHLSLHQQE